IPLEYRRRAAGERDFVSVPHFFRACRGPSPLGTVHPDFYHFVITIFSMNGVLLFFNLIPVYPLDGGQIVRGLLWLKFGPIRSLKAASVIGFAGAILFALWAFTSQDIWLGILAFFIFAQARVGWRAAQDLALESE